MKNGWIKLAIATGLLTSLGAPLFAGQLITAEDPDAILNMAKGYGSAILKKDSTGDPFIVGRIDGTRYSISFYGCKNHKSCKDIQFTAIWSGADTNLKKINQWNSTKRFGKAYIDKDGDVQLNMPVNLRYGVTVDNLDDTFDWWARIMKSFPKEI
jgi:hypothetical protein